MKKVGEFREKRNYISVLVIVALVVLAIIGYFKGCIFFGPVAEELELPPELMLLKLGESAIVSQQGIVKEFHNSGSENKIINLEREGFDFSREQNEEGEELIAPVEVRKYKGFIVQYKNVKPLALVYADAKGLAGEKVNSMLDEGRRVQRG
ncbi:MAG: hypothetical protein ABH864_04700 [archaeon]